MSETFTCVTSTRDDIAAIARILARAIQPDVFFDKHHPLVITVCGSLRCGKSIIKDELIATLFTDQKPRVSGTFEYDEYMMGKFQKQNVPVHYIDAYRDKGFSHPDLNHQLPGLREKAFVDAMRLGGIAIVQNHTLPHAGDINIWMEGIHTRMESMRILGGHAQKRCLPENKGFNDILTGAHERTAGPDGTSWARFVQIEINDKRLSGNKVLTESFAHFAANSNATNAQENRNHAQQNPQTRFSPKGSR